MNRQEQYFTDDWNRHHVEWQDHHRPPQQQPQYQKSPPPQEVAQQPPQQLAKVRNSTIRIFYTMLESDVSLSLPFSAPVFCS
jgi:hypothetical protein